MTLSAAMLSRFKYSAEPIRFRFQALFENDLAHEITGLQRVDLADNANRDFKNGFVCDLVRGDLTNPNNISARERIASDYLSAVDADDADVASTYYKPMIALLLWLDGIVGYQQESEGFKDQLKSKAADVSRDDCGVEKHNFIVELTKRALADLIARIIVKDGDIIEDNRGYLTDTIRHKLAHHDEGEGNPENLMNGEKVKTLVDEALESLHAAT